MNDTRSTIHVSLVEVLAYCLAGACLSIQGAQAQTTVTEIRAVDGKNNGVRSQILERTRKNEDLTIGETDAQGYLKKPVKCPEWHRLFAKPLTGSFTQSDYAPCEEKMVLRLWNVGDYPQSVVRVIVPYAPGSTSDMLARVIGKELSSRWGQQVVIDNRAGAGGNIGADLVARSAPNGYTLLLATSQLFTVYPSIYSKVSYNTEKDFVPVAMVATTPELLVTKSSFPARSVKDLVQYAKARPGEINFASNGQGTESHLAGELFNATAGVKLTHVPYKGAGSATMALMAGNVEIAFASASTVASDIKTGKLIALGVTGAKRSPLFPDVPTIAEGGVIGYEVHSWYGVFSPTGTPAKIVQKLSYEIGKSLQTSVVRERLAGFSAEPVSDSPEQFAAVIKFESSKWAKVVRAANLRAD